MNYRENYWMLNTQCSKSYEETSLKKNWDVLGRLTKTLWKITKFSMQQPLATKGYPTNRGHENVLPKWSTQRFLRYDPANFYKCYLPGSFLEVAWSSVGNNTITLKTNSLIWFCFFLDKIKIAPDLVHNFSNFPNIITTTKWN